jgi:Putative 2OG-Fe(II) oxygenase
MISRGKDVQLRKTALFEIPVWSVDLREIEPYHAEMAAEVEDLIDGVPAGHSARHLAHQTQSDPFGLPSEGWRLLEARCNELYAELARANFQRWRSGQFHLRRWALRLGTLSTAEKEQLKRDALHNHLPALFSSVYYLKVPVSLAGTEEGGTVFVNPLGNLMDIMGPRNAMVAAHEGRLVIFPSFLDHRPGPLDWDSPDDVRIVISTDIFYVSGEARSDPEVTAPGWPISAEGTT